MYGTAGAAGVTSAAELLSDGGRRGSALVDAWSSWSRSESRFPRWLPAGGDSDVVVGENAGELSVGVHLGEQGPCLLLDGFDGV